MQRGGNEDNVGRVDRDTARRTNRFNVSNVATNVTCACTTNHWTRLDTCINVSDCDIHYVNIIVCPEKAEADDSHKNKVSSHDDNWDKETFDVTIAETLEYSKHASSTFISLPDVNFNAGKDTKSPIISTSLETTDLSRKKLRAIRNMQKENVKTDFTSDIKTSSETLNLSKVNNVQSQCCFCFKRQIIPPLRAETKQDILKKRKKVTIYEGSNNICKEIDGRNYVRYCKVNNDTEIDNFDDINKSEKKNSSHLSSRMHNNNLSHYEICRTESKWNDRIVQTISKSYVKEQLNCREVERNLTARDVPEKWMYVEYLIDDILESVKRAILREKLNKNRIENQKSDTATQLSRHKLITVADFTRHEFFQVLSEIKDNTKDLENQLAILNKSIETKRRNSVKSL